jgi:radical SAM superfamily enzyme YgiQ (UPF0313 family)
MSGKSAESYIDPVTELGGLLLTVEKPARYTGGEYGILAKRDSSAALRTVIAFPDIYEIGMGNQALRIIYNSLNAIDGIVCDRAFAPAPDFEKLLREKNLPLYGLDTGISLASCDLLMFTLGYELGLNGILTMLDVSGIPLRCEDRNKPQNNCASNWGEYPVVIAGGPAVSNPLPYSLFIDAFWIGEAEAAFFELAAELSRLKESGQGRAALLEKISCHPNIWVRGKEKTKRAVFSGFCSESGVGGLSQNGGLVFPVPSMKIVQHHGTVEIMRGCPNGCRFCHAGFWYRPMRQKTTELIVRQVDDMVTKGGWREISLSSLSSGDYSGIGELVETLNSRFGSLHVSFQMPSLKVSSFSLSLLEKISATRKSGLTFAVETPPGAGGDSRQAAINKEVTADSVIAILEEAKKRGWKAAKFYFMIGLPLPAGQGAPQCEEEEIVNFIADVGRRARMRFNINVGIFVPKPHTPYQRAPQLDSEEASRRLEFIRCKLKPMGHKVSVCDPLVSRIEGLLSRGDERAGLLCEEAFLGGSRLDAWSEFINREKWLEILERNSCLADFFMSGKNAPLPWQGIDSGVKGEYLEKELENSLNARRTASCKEKCSICGTCREIKPSTQSKEREKDDPPANIPNGVNQELPQVNEARKKSDPDIYRVLFSFSKRESAVFHGHLSLIEIFSMAFTRAGIPVMYTRGFNPLAKIEFASPLTTGICADGEIAAADFTDEMSKERFKTDLNENLPDGIRIEKAECFFIQSGMKKHSLSSLLWGFAYASPHGGFDYVAAPDEKKYRQERLEKDCVTHECVSHPCVTQFSLRRGEVLAKNKFSREPREDDSPDRSEWSSYFDTYRFLYGSAHGCSAN